MAKKISPIRGASINDILVQGGES